MTEMRLRRVAATLPLLVSFAHGVSAQPPDADAVADAVFGACASCHGEALQGRLPKQAPRLAGLDRDYFLRQMRAFSEGIRGGHESDVYGRQMNLMAAAVTDEALLQKLATRVAAMPITAAARTLPGDPQRGAQMYAACAACHGAEGAGNPSLGAPRLAGGDDWYLKRQWVNFRDGARGSEERDHFGRQMAAQASVPRADVDIDDLLAYVATLK